MSLDTLDKYLTEDPNDREVCTEHGYAMPCRECFVISEEERFDRMREERHE